MAYSQTITGLTPGTTYDFQVYAFNTAGNGAASAPAVVVATAGSLVPGAPSALAASSISATSFLLTFAPPTTGSAATSYQVQYKLTSAQTWTNFATPLPAYVTVIVIGAGGSIVDTSGNTWTITAGAQCAINGTPVADTSAVLLLALVDGVMYAENTSNNWYSFTNAGVTTAGPIPNPIAGFNQIATTTTSMVVDTSNNAWTITAGAQMAINGTVVSGTANVVLIALVGGVVWAQNTSNLWYSFTNSGTLIQSGVTTSPLLTISQTVSGLTASTTYDVQVYALNATGEGPASALLVVTTATQAANFYVKNGQLLTPNGELFIGKGLDLADADMYVITGSNGYPVNSPSYFGGLNIIRLVCLSYQAPSYYESFVNTMTALGIVVVFDDHQNFNANGTSAGDAGGTQGVILTGSLLTTELNWWAALASYYINNPYVWFDTNNEPSGTDPTTGQWNLGELATWMGQQYNAIRGAGNNNIVCICLGAENGYGTASGLTASVFESMTNVCWDFHQYSGAYTDYNYSVVLTQSQLQADISASIAAVQGLLSADGVMPCLALEYGPSTGGVSIDASGYTDVTCVQTLCTNQGLGTNACTAAWCWGSSFAGTGDIMNTSDTGGSLTTYGQMVQAWIQNGTP